MWKICFLILVSLSACKTTGRSSENKAYLVNQGDKQRRIYYMENDLLKTALCPGELPKIDTETTKLSDIQALCQEQVSVGVSIETFRQAMIAFFKKTYSAKELSAYEESSLAYIITQIQDQQSIFEGTEAEKGSSDPFEIDSIWLQFMPFAAGAVAGPLPPSGPEVAGGMMREMQVTLGSDQAEYELQGAEFSDDVNLLTVFASTEDQKQVCPAFIDVLSVSTVSDGQAIPAFGGAVIGGSRFLLNQFTKNIANVRIAVTPSTEAASFVPGMRCVLAVFSTRVEAAQIGLNINVPKPVALDARDQKMADLMAKPEVRSWHFLWHGIRNGWEDFSQEEKQEIEKKLGTEWSRDVGGTGDPKEKGEEFLEMHHTMLSALSKYLGKDMYEAWSQPPAPNDGKFGVPSYGDPAQKVYIEARCNSLMNMHRKANDPAFVKRLTLSEYGLWLEENMHNLMHSTWAHPTQWYRSYSPTMQEIMSQPNKYPSFNHPSNNSLNGTYTSHVNPIFYRLHGYVDARLQTWLSVHGYKSISRSCPSEDETCYQWKRTWTGQLPDTVAKLTTEHEHGVDPKKIADISPEVFREIARNSQMIPEFSDPEKDKK